MTATQSPTANLAKQPNPTTINVPLLPITGILCWQKLLRPNQSKDLVWFLSLMLDRNFVFGQPLANIFDQLDQVEKKRLKILLLNLPSSTLDFFFKNSGQQNTASKFLKRKLEVIGKSTRKKHGLYSNPIEEKIRPNSKLLFTHKPKGPIEKRSILRFMERHKLVAFPVNKQAETMVKCTQNFLDVFQANIIDAKVLAKVKTTHANNLRNSYIFGYVRMPRLTFQAMCNAYCNISLDFLPFALLYQVAYSHDKGLDLQLNLNKWAHMLGFTYKGDDPYCWITHRLNQLKKKLGPNLESTLFLNYRILKIADIQRLDPGGDLLTKDGVTCRKNIPFHHSKCQLVLGPNGYDIGVRRGSVIADNSKIPPSGKMTHRQYHEALPVSDLAYDNRRSSDYSYFRFFPEEFIRPEYNHPIFTNSQQCWWAYCHLMSENHIDKPSKERFGEIKDSSWNEDMQAIVDADYNLTRCVEPIRNYLVEKQNAKDVVVKEVERRGVHSIVHDAHLYLQGKKKSNWENIDFKMIPKDDGGKRPIYLTGLDQTVVEKSLGCVSQAALVNVIRQLMPRAFSGYMPGLCPAYKLVSIKYKMTTREEVSIANLDIKKCFEKIKWDNAHFLKRMVRSRQLLVKKGFHKEADVLWEIFHDYFYRNLKEGRYSYINKSPGSQVPSGFPLSPNLLVFLLLPVAYHLHYWQEQGKVLCFDICGDDSIVVVLRKFGDKYRKIATSEHFRFARELDLNYHYWKNYRVGKVPDISRKYSLNRVLPKHQIQGDYRSAWVVEWPKHRVPLFHAGSVFFKSTIIPMAKITDDPDQMTLQESLFTNTQLLQRHAPTASDYIIRDRYTPDEDYSLARNVPEDASEHSPLSSTSAHTPILDSKVTGELNLEKEGGTDATSATRAGQIECMLKSRTRNASKRFLKVCPTPLALVREDGERLPGDELFLEGMGPTRTFPTGEYFVINHVESENAVSQVSGLEVIEPKSYHPKYKSAKDALSSYKFYWKRIQGANSGRLATDSKLIARLFSRVNRAVVDYCIYTAPEYVRKAMSGADGFRGKASNLEELCLLLEDNGYNEWLNTSQGKIIKQARSFLQRECSIDDYPLKLVPVVQFFLEIGPSEHCDKLMRALRRDEYVVQGIKPYLADEEVKSGASAVFRRNSSVETSIIDGVNLLRKQRRAPEISSFDDVQKLNGDELKLAISLCDVTTRVLNDVSVIKMLSEPLSETTECEYKQELVKRSHEVNALRVSVVGATNIYKGDRRSFIM